MATATAFSTQLVRAIFVSLTERGVAFVVLRNYEELPFDIGNDLDLLVAERQRDLAEQIVTAAAADCGFRLHNRAEGPHIMLYFTHEETLAQVHVDLFADFMWRGFTLLTAEEICARRTHGDLFAVPHPVHEALINLLATVLYQGTVKAKYRPGIAAALAAHGEFSAELLNRLFGRRLAARLVADVNHGQWDGIAACTGALSRSLMMRRLRSSPLATLRSVWRNEARRIWQRIRWPVGISVAIIGPDGSGKTTIARALPELLAGTWRLSSIHYIHWKPPVFGSLSSGGPPVTAPHGAPVRDRVRSRLFFLYHAAGFAAGGLRHIVPLTIGGGLVVLDRYYYDFFVDQRRFRMAVPRQLVEAAFRFVVKPDLVFYLDSSPELAQARKAEVPLVETSRQRAAYLDLVRWLPNAQVIDASRAVDVVAADVARRILLFMAERTASRERRRLGGTGRARLSGPASGHDTHSPASPGDTAS